VIADQFPSWLHLDVPEWLICAPAPMLSKTMTEQTDSALGVTPSLRVVTLRR
jgi:hypothetical protein